MEQIAVALKSSFFASSLLLSIALPAVAIADATTNVNPTVATNIKTANGDCTNNNEMAVTTAGKPIKCIGNKWRYLGLSGLYRSHVGEIIKASDIGTYKTMTTTCPPGKRVLSGGCALLAGYDETQPLVVNIPSADLTYWQCTYGPLNSNARDPYRNPLDGSMSPANMSIEVNCADY